MNHYKLLTPGPLTTSETVKAEMMIDRCTWDDDYKVITRKIRTRLLELAGADESAYTSVLMQGSGTFCVESVITSSIGKEDKALILTNGAYGERIVRIAQMAGIAHTEFKFAYDGHPDEAKLRAVLEADPALTHLVLVHCETTTGILNPLDQASRLAEEYGKILIVDAMSSFGGVEIDVPALGIDFLISSANKCIQGVPGFGFVIARRDLLEACNGRSPSLSLDLYDQWRVMEADGKWRFTSPTHTVAAFSKALDELEEEGGVAARNSRYAENNRRLRERMEAAGFRPYISADKQSPIITAFRYPDENFHFDAFYDYLKEEGFVIYPGKLTDEDTFRIGNIGEIYPADIERLCGLIENYGGVMA
ncbi:2-aminoethylphosphonate--pyruvate transaminase [Edaphobacillus lindanitolerans]|uniref:2-aminoethylphosphonate--pyruvate transaminase n=1 Tax=Edaphobacillus lindanitolerans TaxID=550447 RepID=A0A1U7PNJ9_9BACI|nr:2-aminoethylphosphonate--pyruvate transaminase [Edaphobacillus lindanitolerans]SIT72965.1 2-aminoethylphosphonate-pyruvate transaminase [Edaphobacillus lindanitolerans]